MVMEMREVSSIDLSSGAQSGENSTDNLGDKI